MSAWSPRPSSAPSDQVVGRAGPQPGGGPDAQLAAAAPGGRTRPRLVQPRVVVVAAGPARRPRRAAQVARAPSGPSTAGTGRGRRGSRTSARRRRGRASAGLLQLEGRVGGAELDHVARLERLRRRSIRRPLTLTPLVEPRSRTVHEPPDGRISACLRETLASSTTMSHSRERPSTAPAEPSSSVAPVDAQPRAARAAGPARAAAPRAARRWSRPSCGPPRAWRGSAAGILVRAHEPRLDAELAEPQPLVGLERDLGRRQQRDPLAARVLEQVARQLARAARPRSPRTARGRRARARPCTRWARRCG